jgi:hypothetical protein
LAFLCRKRRESDALAYIDGGTHSSICGSAARNLTAVEWRQYFGDDPFVRTCQELPIDRSVHFGALERAFAMRDAGQTREANARMRTLISLSEGADAAVNGSVCWYAALVNLADEAAPACERSRARSPAWYAGAYGDSRAVALAMRGKFVAAAEELRAHLVWLGQHASNQGLSEARQHWLAELKQNANPFTKKVREEILASDKENSWKLAPFEVLRD